MGTPQKSLAASVENDLRREAIELRIEGEEGNQDRPMSWLHRDPVSPFGEIRRKWSRIPLSRLSSPDGRKIGPSKRRTQKKGVVLPRRPCDQISIHPYFKPVIFKSLPAAEGSSPSPLPTTVT